MQQTYTGQRASQSTDADVNLESAVGGDCAVVGQHSVGGAARRVHTQRTQHPHTRSLCVTRAAAAAAAAVL